MTTVLISGCSTGIGRATALHLARQGYLVYAGLLNPAMSAEGLEREAKSENLALRIHALDVTDESACIECVDRIRQEQGQLDVLINNAGIALVSSLEETSEADGREIMEVNFFGPFRLMRQVIPAMREARSGTIINVTSLAGRMCMAFNPSYAASKFALEAASESMAFEVARFNIRVALIEPGVTLTAMQDKVPLPPDDSPYAELLPRAMQIYGDAIANPKDPIEVAEVIRQAIETDSPSFRYVVGDDAQRMVAGRSRLTDEEWIAFGTEMSDEAYTARVQEYFRSG